MDHVIFMVRKKWICNFHSLKKRVKGSMIEEWQTVLAGVHLIVKEFVFSQKVEAI